MHKNNSGFTLLELSIVLVIIGLIVGGVLVGQDLIKNAGIRATISQYEKYNSAVNTFRTKYNAVPGDISSANATQFGIYSSGVTTSGLGDANGLITDTGVGAAMLNAPVGETLIFWRHLTEAALLDGAYGMLIQAANGQLAASGATPAQYLPEAKIGKGNYWMVGSGAGINYYVLANVTGVTTGAAATATYTTTVGGTLSPIEAYNMDIKVDDGMPNLGVVQARGHATMAAATDTLFPPVGVSSRPTWSTATIANAAAGDCTTTGASGSDTTNTYARNQVAGNAPACSLRLRFN